MPCTIIVGGQWGDEAKGKMASYLALKDDVDLAVRAGLGPGAGHTIVHGGRTHKLRQIPSAVVNGRTRLLLGAGVLVNPAVLLREIEELGVADRVGVDFRATVIDPAHLEAEQRDRNLTDTVRSTGSGHGPALAARALRNARRAMDVPELAPYLADVAVEVNGAVDAGAQVQVEGTNGFGLSVLYGTYPHTVGKDSTASTAAADAGLGPLAVDDVVLVFRAYPTRVGAGAFPTELSEQEAERIGVEYGTVTGRRRRMGRFDLDQAREAVRINRPSRVAVSFLDYAAPEVRGRREGPLPPGAAADLIDEIERGLGVRVDLIGTGPGTDEVIDLRSDPVGTGTTALLSRTRSNA
ncbi:adenylosuccinate synthetase [Streptomyces rimosus]|uniref:adenylosuccinate synthetase n=1 Tax=Streptomyces rimosus TaxID=1927 RepID=UPI00067C4399|nr:adenylosuccinate synthetase [Streptomyces rimosus]